jgi:hypothetical protein
VSKLTWYVAIRSGESGFFSATSLHLHQHRLYGDERHLQRSMVTPFVILFQPRVDGMAATSHGKLAFGLAVQCLEDT